jgi:hypothetical protein
MEFSMTGIFSTVWTWVHDKIGTITAGAKALEPEIVAWASNFLSAITPVIKQAATDAVLAAITVPGTGEVKAAAALAAATADLASKGVPIVENDLKAAIQIAYNALPASMTGNTAAAAVVTAADNAVDSAGAKLQAAAPASGA